MDSDSTAPTELNRREFIRRASAAAIAGLGAPYVIAQRTEETLVVNSFGGEYQELFEKAVIQPFEKKFGVKVVHDTTGTSAQDYAKIRAAKGAPGFDVAAALSPPEVLLGVEGRAAREDHGEGSPEHQVHLGEGAPVASAHRRDSYAAVRLAAVQQGQDRQADVVGRLLATGQALWREGQGPPHQLQPGEPAVGLRADPRGGARRRQCDEHGTGLGAAEGRRSPTSASS